MKNKKVIKLILLILIFILIIIGITYAFMSPNTKSNNGKVNITSGEMKLSYTDSVIINATNIEPGWTSSKSIVINNTGDYDAVYDLVWLKMTNNFVDQSDLAISGVCSSNVSNCISYNFDDLVMSPTGVNYLILKDIHIKKNETQTFNLTFKFLEDNLKDQSVNLNKNFNGVIGIKVGNYGSNIVYNSISSSNYAEQTLGNAIFTNNTVITTDPTINKTTVSQTFLDNIKNNKTTEELAEIDNRYIVENGLYRVNGNNNGYTYIFRGIVNNKVRFGGYIWRIIRINEDGSIRLVLTNPNSTYDDVSYTIPRSNYRDLYNNYESSWYKDFEFKTETNYVYSINKARKTLESFYDEFLVNYDNYIVNTSFCNNTSTINAYPITSDEFFWTVFLGNPYPSEEDKATIYSDIDQIISNRSDYDNMYDLIIQVNIVASSMTRQEAIEELNLSYLEYKEDLGYISFENISTGNPDLSCNQSKDNYSLKIGLLTADEVNFAGASYSYAANTGSESLNAIRLTDSYLNELQNNGLSVYTMTPINKTNMFWLSFGGLTFVDNTSTNKMNGDEILVNPVISLNKNVLISSGDGTDASPYIIN